MRYAFARRVVLRGKRWARLGFAWVMVMVCTSALFPVQAQEEGLLHNKKSLYVKLRNVPVGSVSWTEGFWADKFETIREAGIPSMWETLKDPEISHAYSNFRVAAGLEEGGFHGWWWLDGDFYKWTQAVSSVYAITKDPELDRLLDEVIDVISKAQREDGYLHTSIQIGHGYRHNKNLTFEGKTQPFQKTGDHELYNMGHLMTAACIHYRATGKRNFLKVAIKTGDFLYNTFISRDPALAHFDFNPSNIMGTVELYRTTGDQKYLKLAQTFVDMRGSQPGGSDWTQTDLPLRKETEAVGHAVTGNYLYSGAIDVYSETGEKALLDAVSSIWENVALKKVYVTGATGAYHAGASSRGSMVRGDLVNEAYGRNYELPNATAYNETCANIAFAMWNWRMLGIAGDAKYAELMETVFYNSALSGISLDGRRFYYTNPLRRMSGSTLLSLDSARRVSFIPSFCCPPNIVRTIAEMGNYMYSLGDNALWVNLYGGGVLKTELRDGSSVTIEQITDYPWSGDVRFVLHEYEGPEFGLMLRIPEWASGASLKVNGKASREKPVPGAYFELSRNWKKGDVVELRLPMKPRLIEANPLVEETKNQVAVKRGPIVYCLESPDLPDGISLGNVVLPERIVLKPTYRKDLLGGVTTLKGEALSKEEPTWGSALYQEHRSVAMRPVDIELIPYYAWSNRGVSEMSVWLPLVYAIE